MKRLFIILIFLPTVALGQGFGGGLFAGVSATQMLGDDIGGFHKAGVYAGAFTDYRFTPKSALQLEFAFLQRGSRQTPTVKNGQQAILHNLNYLETGLIYRWYGIKNMSIEVGPTASYLINSVHKESTGNVLTEVANPVIFRKFDLSGAVGLSYYLLKGKLEVNARYSNSIIPTSTDYARRWYHHVMVFSIRYWFKTTINQAKEAIGNNKVKVNVNLGENDE